MDEKDKPLESQEERACRGHNLDRAEELLKKTLTNTADFTMLWVQLYQKKGEMDKALGTVQRNLYKLLSEARTCLMSLLGNHMEFDKERTLEICNIFCKQEELFGVGGGLGAGVVAEVYLRLGMKQESLDYLEQFANRLIEGITCRIRRFSIPPILRRHCS